MQKFKPPLGLNLDKGPFPWTPGYCPGDGSPEEILTPSCVAVRHAVSQLYRLDDFQMHKIGSGFFSDVYKVRQVLQQIVFLIIKRKYHSVVLWHCNEKTT